MKNAGALSGALGRHDGLGNLMGRHRDIIGRFGGVRAGLSQQDFVRHTLGVTFLKFSHVEIMARDLEVSLAHVKTRRSLGKMKIFGGAIPISPGPHPKSKFAYRISSWHVPPTRCSIKNTDCGEANGTQLSRS
jgi:hypothetical protein